VDFVLYGEGVFVAIEVKNSRKVDRKDLRGLQAFREDYPESQVLLLHRGNESLRVEGIPCLPCSVFLKGLIPGEPVVAGGA
jgi:predicted AAA+ superfamily ATPase